jgi:hypothetical protein
MPDDGLRPEIIQRQKFPAAHIRKRQCEAAAGFKPPFTEKLVGVTSMRPASLKNSQTRC